MSDWGKPCLRCGHPASYHGVSFCQVAAGSSIKKPCDCIGYDNPDRQPQPAWTPTYRWQAANPGFDASKCPCQVANGGSGVCGCVMNGPTVTC
jgi:hypothetical protein